MSFCSNCGAQLGEGAKFCPRCGTAVAPAATPVDKPAAPPVVPAAQTPRAATPTPTPARSTPPPPQARTMTPAGAPIAAAPPKRNTWWIVPAVIVGLILILFLVLTGLPFGGDDELERKEVPLERVEEGTSTQAPSATIVEASPGDTDSVQSPQVTQTAPPPMATTSTAPPAVAPRTVPPAAAVPQPIPTVPSAPPAATTQTASPPASAPARGRELSEREAAAILRTAAMRYYDDVSSDCVELRSHGYVNVGYTMTVWNRCASGGIRMLGRWRVDTEKGEVFRQRDNGKYLAP